MSIFSAKLVRKAEPDEGHSHGPPTTHELERLDEKEAAEACHHLILIDGACHVGTATGREHLLDGDRGLVLGGSSRFLPTEHPQHITEEQLRAFNFAFERHVTESALLKIPLSETGLNYLSAPGYLIWFDGSIEPLAVGVAPAATPDDAPEIFVIPVRLFGQIAAAAARAQAGAFRASAASFGAVVGGAAPSAPD